MALDDDLQGRFKACGEDEPSPRPRRARRAAKRRPLTAQVFGQGPAGLECNL